MNPVFLLLAMVLLAKSSWIQALGIVLFMVAFFAVNLIWSQESMLYVPCVMPGMQRPSDNPAGYRSPAEKSLAFEDVNLTTADGFHIHGWFIPSPSSSSTAPTLLFCHENAGNVGLRIPNFERMREKLQVNILAIDYRGYGCSEGFPSEEGLIEDALCSWKWLQAKAEKKEIDGDKLFVFGRSLGGAVAIALASTLQQRDERGPCGMILENTFLSIGDMVDTLFPIIAFKCLKDRFLRLRWHSFERVRDVEVPLLFLCGEKDEVVPPVHMVKLEKSAVRSRSHRLVLFAEGQHNDTWEKCGERYWEAQASFMAECCPSEPTPGGG
jgi:pimeloyl-ACP methyl ester carboxylesterase